MNALPLPGAQARRVQPAHPTARPDETVEPATREDVAGLARLLWSAVPGCSHSTLRRLATDWRHYWVLREADGRPFAAAALVPVAERLYELRGLTVSASRRGTGASTRLMNHLMGRADALRADVRCISRSPAYFRRHGFVPEEPAWLRLAAHDDTAGRRVALRRAAGRRPRLRTEPIHSQRGRR